MNLPSVRPLPAGVVWPQEKEDSEASIEISRDLEAWSSVTHQGGKIRRQEHGQAFTWNHLSLVICAQL
jgi:hypothetical protein